MHVKWGSLGEVALVSLGVTVGVVVLFSIGILAVSSREAALEHGRSAARETVTAAVCFAACTLIVLYGLYLIIPQFH